MKQTNFDVLKKLSLKELPDYIIKLCDNNKCPLKNRCVDGCLMASILEWLERKAK